MTNQQQHAIQYGNTTIEYALSYTDRETLAIHVHPDTHVSVDAPIGSELAEIEKRVHKRASWIVKQQRDFERYYYEVPARKYVSGESHRYLGRQYRLKVLPSQDGESIKMDRGRFLIHTREKDNRERKKQLLDNWYRGHAQRVFTERVKKWHPHFQRYHIPLPQVVIRRMKTRWGSCTAEGKITLNLKLIQVPKHLIDYVIVHELSHIVEHNHSDEFYALLTRIMPDWEERRETLNRFEF